MFDSFLVFAQAIHVLIRLYMCADQLVHAQIENTYINQGFLLDHWY